MRKMTNQQREGFVPYWLQTATPFGPQAQPSSLPPTGPWPFPPIDSALLAMFDSSKLPIPPATPPWFPPAAPITSATGYVDSTGYWGAAQALPAVAPPLSTRGILGSFGQPQYGVPAVRSDPAAHNAYNAGDIAKSFGIGGSRRPGDPREYLSPDDIVRGTHEIRDATLAGLQLLLPHIADPDFWKPPGPPSLTPTPEGKLSPADYDPRRAGVAADLLNLAVNAAPVGGPAKAAAEVGAKAVPAALRRIAGSAVPQGEVERAALTAGMHDAPLKPSRPFSADYTSGAPADDSGRLLFDIEGRPLRAKYIAGRRVAGGEDVRLTPVEIWDLVKRAIGRPPKEYAERTMKGESGFYGQAYDEQGNLVRRRVAINRELEPEQKRYVLAHETGHMAHDLANGMSLSFIQELERELKPVYSTLNTGREGRQPPFLPQNRGYSDSEAPFELVAEFIRAYLTNPNYAKTVAPNAAAKLRALVNSHPQLSKLIQFNTLGGLAVLGGELADPDDQPSR
jgi:hypothetical protein